MNLKALFESGVLNADTQKAIEEQFDVALKVKEAELQEGYEAKLAEAKTEMFGSVMELVEEAVAEQMQEIAEEVKHARTLEVQYAEKLQMFKEEYAQAQEEQMKVLVAESVAEELDQIKEYVEMVKKHEFVMDMFETYKSSYERLFGTSDVNAYDELQEAKAELEQYKRQEKLDSLLESLTGAKRAVAETILEGVALDKLEEKFESIKPALLAEAKKEEQGNEAPITESAQEGKEVKGMVVLENEEDNSEAQQVNESAKNVDPYLKRLEKSLKFAKGK